MNAPHYTAMGKEVLRDDRHFLDATSANSAMALAAVLNGQVLLNPDDAEKADVIAKELWG